MRAKIILTTLLVGLLGLTANAGPLSFGGSPSGYMNVFELDGVTSVFGSSWGVDSLKTVTTNDITFELHPNYNGYADNVGSTNVDDVAFWTDSVDGGVTPGADGNKVLEAVTLFELDHALTADLTNAVFNYTVDNGTDLNITRYLSTGFIQVIDTNGNAVAEATVINNALGPVPLSLDLTEADYTGHVLQAGWRIKGLNANPADDLGKMLVTKVNLYAASGDNYAPVPVGFESPPSALSGTQMTMTAAEAIDYYTVEYEFSNTTISVSSGWQTNQVWVDSGVELPATTNAVDLITDPTYLDLGWWEGYADGGAKAPSTFATVSSGVATVTPGTSSEWNFYKTFSDINLGQSYTFSIVSDNDTTEGTTEAVAFVKVFDGGWSQIGGESQTVALPMNGSTTTINFTPVAGVYYQVGTYTIGTTSGSYDVSSPSLMTTNVVDGGYAGLTPDTEYVYTLRARDLSPQTNVSAWATTVAGISTVSDDTAPSPDPMLFSIPPTAIGETAISMIAANAVDDEFGVEYLFTNVTTGGSSGWQTDSLWTDVGNLAVTNADFELGTDGWTIGDHNVGWGDPSGGSLTNLGAGNHVYLYVDGSEENGNGGYSVAYPIENVALAGSGFNAGDDILGSADIKALAGLNGGGAGLKLEFYDGAGGLINNPATEYLFNATEEWANYSFTETVPAQTKRVKIVLLVTTGWDGANLLDSHYLFDNLVVGKGAEFSLEPGTEYAFKVKARDTSPVKNETDWSASASATTFGSSSLDPLVPFDITGSSIAGGDAVFTWEAISGHLYDVLYKTNLVTDLIWVTNETIEAAADGTLSATTTVDGAVGFIRIQGR